MMVKITPLPGRRVRNPEAGNAVVPAEGMPAQDSAHWRFLQRVGDITLEPLAVQIAAPPSAEPQN